MVVLTGNGDRLVRRSACGAWQRSSRPGSASANTGFVMTLVSVWPCATAHERRPFFAQRHQLHAAPQAVRTGIDFAAQFGVEIFQRSRPLLQTMKCEIVGDLVDRRLAIELASPGFVTLDENRDHHLPSGASSFCGAPANRAPIGFFAGFMSMILFRAEHECSVEELSELGLTNRSNACWIYWRCRAPPRP
jgi:hypothetical protein